MSRLSTVLQTCTAPYKTYHPYAIIKLRGLKLTFHKVYGPKQHKPDHQVVHGRTGKAKHPEMPGVGHYEGRQE